MAQHAYNDARDARNELRANYPDYEGPEGVEPWSTPGEKKANNTLLYAGVAVAAIVGLRVAGVV